MKRPDAGRGRTAASRPPTTDAVEILHRRYIEGDPEAEALVEQYRADDEVAQAIYDLRTAAGLTQAQLARRIGTQKSAISRLEDADYEGHSLAMLRKVARALGKRVELRFVDNNTEGTGEEATPVVPRS